MLSLFGGQAFGSEQHRSSAVCGSPEVGGPDRFPRVVIQLGDVPAAGADNRTPTKGVADGQTDPEPRHQRRPLRRPDNPTGLWLSELTHAWHVFETDQGEVPLDEDCLTRTPSGPTSTSLTTGSLRSERGIKGCLGMAGLDR